jgi:hypothetical protein
MTLTPYSKDTLVQQTSAEYLERNKQYHFVVAEIRELEELLATLPEENVIERISLEARLQCARARLARLRKLEDRYAE